MTRSALFLKHRPVAYQIAKGFHLPGSDDDDVRQEALIGLWQASGNWNQEKSSFTTYANLVIRNHLNDCLRTATRLKRRVLTDAQREWRTASGEWVSVADILSDPKADPERRISAMEILATMARLDLSPWEREVLTGRMKGLSFAEISSPAHRDKKAVENALVRVRRKVMAA